MADAVEECHWSHTSAILAQIYNVNCAKASALKSADDFNPLKPRKRKRKTFDIEAFKMCVPGYRAARVKKWTAAAETPQA